jgi:hypothetical protein
MALHELIDESLLTRPRAAWRPQHEGRDAMPQQWSNCPNGLALNLGCTGVKPTHSPRGIGNRRANGSV